ncbi:MAG TPA: prolyl oligopeptidase family serine peptidase [Thermoanaerobaculia bacterium]|nr:prolyl oligopeptidase family serine peptidase [Thermoanaerobaculia bacterium]
MRVPLDLYLEQPRIREAVLSPAGDRVAALLREPRGVSVWVIDLAAGGRREKRFESRMVERLHWSADGEGLVLETVDRLAFLPLAGGRPTLFLHLDPLREQRFSGIDLTHPRHVLVSEKEAEGRFRLLRVGVDGGTEVVFAGDQPIRRFVLDREGRLRVLLRAAEAAGGRPELVVERVDGQGRREALRCDALDACEPLAVDGSGRVLVRARLDGDLLRLWAVDPATGAREPLTADPEGFADLRTVELDAQSGRPLAAVYDTDRRRIYGLDAEVEGHLAPLRRRFGEASLDLQGRAGGPFWLLLEAGPRLQHPRYHLYHPAAKRLVPFLEAERASVPMLPEGRLVAPRAVSWRASDGMLLHGWLTTPAGVDPRTVPLVVRVHGGPWNHVRSGWSALTQLLVERGYAVFEPNFRASTGYGLAYTTAAKGDFGNGRVQGDILDGLDALHAQGIGDPQRVAIVGHSFGGFSTLGGLAFTPKRFRAGVASAPSIDLLRTLSDLDEEELQGNGLPLKRVVEQLIAFEDPRVATELRRKSPEAHLAATERPLLIFAGGQDERVDVVDVQHYAQALHDLGRDVTLVVDETQGHNFETRLAMRAYLTLTERFLGKHLGVAMEQEEDPEVETYLRGVVRLGGGWIATSDEAP